MSELKRTSSPSQTVPRIIRLGEVRRLTGLSAQTLWRWEQSGIFPPRLKLGPQAIGWYEADVRAWVISRAQPAGEVPTDDSAVAHEGNVVTPNDIEQTG